LYRFGLAFAEVALPAAPVNTAGTRCPERQEPGLSKPADAEEGRPLQGRRWQSRQVRDAGRQTGLSPDRLAGRWRRPVCVTPAARAGIRFAKMLLMAIDANAEAVSAV